MVKVAPMIKPFRDGRDRFFRERLGLFIHWGLYAIPAWHEQILWRSDMKRSTYEMLVSRFNPNRFDPDEWLVAAESAGMSFLMITTKHHDGFCLWDTNLTDYSVTNTPYGKDILAEIAVACEKRGIALSFYYSCPDWHHPYYPNMGRHHEMFGPRPSDQPDLTAYWDFVRGQVRELCTNYGPLRDFFWDVNVAGYQDPSLNEMIRELQPGILINDRGPSPGDYVTPERHVPNKREFESPTQAVQALGRESWGYREDEDYYSDRYIIESIDRTLAMGGDYILNVGPKADGSFPEENILTLAQVGNWYRSVVEAFEGTVSASTVIDDDAIAMHGDLRIPRDSMLITRKTNTLYIHLPISPQSTGLILKPLRILPKRATLLNDGTELQAAVETTPWHWQELPYLRLSGLPVNRMTETVMVIRLDFSHEVAE